MNQLKVLGPTYALGLTTSVSNALQIQATSPTRAFRVAILNTGSGVASVTFGTTDSNMATPTIASSGNSGTFVLPANMIYPIILDCPAPNFYLKGTSSSTNTIYVTLVATE